ncbi:MAG TPA: nitroreductase family protein [Asticcacaulis sp.]|nr:nitroreductase family protein [Asticcacaulis sp.]
MDAIYGRRTVRCFSTAKVPDATIHALLYAAVQAPTLSQGAAPIGFSVITNHSMLNVLSDWTTRSCNTVEGDLPSMVADIDTGDLTASGLFHGAGTLIVLYIFSSDERHVPECWMAADNIMLAACGMGLGTCLIAPALGALNTPEWKKRLDVPESAQAGAAIVVGFPVGPLPRVNRFPPEIVSWIS